MKKFFSTILICLISVAAISALPLLPEFSEEGGEVPYGTEIFLSYEENPGVLLYYTIDETDPVTNGYPYIPNRSHIYVNRTMTIKVVGLNSYDRQVTNINERKFTFEREEAEVDSYGRYSEPYDIGDVIFTDGSACSANDELTEEQIEKAIGVVFYIEETDEYDPVVLFVNIDSALDTDTYKWIEPEKCPAGFNIKKSYPKTDYKRSFNKPVDTFYYEVRNTGKTGTTKYHYFYGDNPSGYYNKGSVQEASGIDEYLFNEAFPAFGKAGYKLDQNYYWLPTLAELYDFAKAVPYLHPIISVLGNTYWTSTTATDMNSVGNTYVVTIPSERGQPATFSIAQRTSSARVIIIGSL